MTDRRLPRPASTGTLAAAVRILLLVALVHALAPGIAEVAEAAVHWARTGHAAHSAEDHGDLGDQGREHGCGTTQHRCTCCAAQAIAPAPEVDVETLEPPAAAALPERGGAVATRAPDRPFRPPIS